MFWIILFVIVIPVTLALLLAIAETSSSSAQRAPRKVSPRAYRLGQWIGRRIAGGK
jgi:hypothetical protein